PVRSSLLERDPLPEVKDAYNVMSRKESHRGVLESFGVTETRMNASSFAPKCFNNGNNNNNTRSFNNTNNNTRENVSSNRGTNHNLNCKNYGKIGHTIERCYELVGFLAGFKRSSNNVKQGYNANVDVKQNEKVSSGNSSPGLTRLGIHFPLSDHKSETLGELVHLDLWCPNRVPSREGFKNILTIVDDISRLYGSEKCVLIAYSTVKKAYKLLSMDSQNAFYSRDVRFYKNIFPFKQKTCDITDVENISEVDHLKFFDSQKLQSPNDDAKDTSVVDGSLQPSTDTGFSTSPTQFNDSLVDVQKPGIRTSSRQSKFPVRLNDYVLSSNVKYGIDKYLNYSKLKGDILCFATTLNKSVKPSCLKDALSDPNWVEALNNKIEALNRNNTWTECDLPLGRKPIGSKWIWKIKYETSVEVER
nr:hypothetical protein [Tanacetum cinerariifolium]